MTNLVSVRTAVEPAAFKLADAARYMSVSPVTLRRLVANGRIKRHPAFRHLVIPRAQLDKFLAEVEG